MSITALPAKALLQRAASANDDGMPARQAAVEQFLARGFPTTRHEDWKYTDLSRVIDVSERALETRGAIAVDTNDVDAIKASIDAHWIVIANGDVSPTLSSGLDAVDVRDISDAVDTQDPLADLNAALATTRIEIRVAGESALQKPVGLLFVDSVAEESDASYARVNISASAGSKAQFIEYHASAGAAEHYANTHISLQIADGASIDYVRLQRRASQHLHTARLNVELQERAVMRHFAVDLGAALARNDLKVDIAGADAVAEFHGLYIAADKQHVDNHTRVDHRVGPARSAQEYRGILAGRSRGVWNGKAVVSKGADGTDAEQANHNLLLSPHCEINAKPELEIYADEVKCAHGTTVGQLDEKALFYLRSRGLDKKYARRILTRAFATSVVGNAPIDALRELISTLIEQRFAEIGEGSD